MTVCVASLSDNEKCIVCVADKALSYGDYIQWDSDCSKIISLHDKAIALVASGRESHVTAVMEHIKAKCSFSGNRLEILSSLEEVYGHVFKLSQISEVLRPQLLSEEDYIKTIKTSKLNNHMVRIAELISQYILDCDLLICGFDNHESPYIYHIMSPGLVTDFTNVGFHAIGSGAEKAVSQLLFDEHKRSHNIARTLYECFDGKAHAEMAVGVGYGWDACFVTNSVIRPLADDGKRLVDKIWSKYNRSPFKKEKDDDELEDPPDDWDRQLDEIICSSLTK